jgi:molybdenum cofactor sulfurtransferase
LHDGETALLEELRRNDFARLDAGEHVYLDYTGAGLYADSQLSEHVELLRSRVFGNPHSLNPTSSAMTELVEHARDSVLAFFRASPEEYVAIFTPNATGALRLVGEAYFRVRVSSPKVRSRVDGLQLRDQKTVD